MKFFFKGLYVKKSNFCENICSIQSMQFLGNVLNLRENL
jgi:hypothetical protein